MPLSNEQRAAFGWADEEHFAWQLQHPYVSVRERLLVRATFEPLGQRLLDVGCGEGATLVHLGAPNTAVGLDASEAKIAFANAWASKGSFPGPRFVVGDAEALPFEAHSFDQLIVRDLVHHLKDPCALVAEAHRVLEPGGRLDLLEPCRYNPLIAAHALTVPAERGELRSTVAYLQRLFGERFELESQRRLQALPIHRLVFHPRLGRPELGEHAIVRSAVDAFERAASWLLPRWTWSYLHLRLRRS